MRRPSTTDDGSAQDCRRQKSDSTCCGRARARQSGSHSGSTHIYSGCRSCIVYNIQCCLDSQTQQLLATFRYIPVCTLSVDILVKYASSDPQLQLVILGCTDSTTFSLVSARAYVNRDLEIIRHSDQRGDTADFGLFRFPSRAHGGGGRHGGTRPSPSLFLCARSIRKRHIIFLSCLIAAASRLRRYHANSILRVLRLRLRHPSIQYPANTSLQAIRYIRRIQHRGPQRSHLEETRVIRQALSRTKERPDLPDSALAE